MPYAQNNETAQYVGARYVPKFYQNSQNPSSNAWEGNTAYEAMVIVTYNNSSYTSKQPVPAGIGNPAQNPTYWVNTGNYNAQVEEYRQETVQAVQTAQDVQNNLTQEIEKVEEYRQETVQAVQTVQDVQNNLTQEIKKVEEYRQETVQAVQTAQDVQNNLTQEIEDREQAVNSINLLLNTPTILCVGDSYGKGYHDDAEHLSDSWPTLLGKYTHCKIENYCVSGATAESGITGSYYAGQIDAAKVAGVNADIIVLSAGTNDYLATNLASSLGAFIQHTRTVYPNAKLFIDWNSVSYKKANGERKTFEEYYNTYNTYLTTSISYMVPFSVSAIEARFANNSTSSDQIHLTANGYEQIAYTLACEIFGGGVPGNNANLAFGGVSAYNYILQKRNKEITITQYTNKVLAITTLVKEGALNQNIYNGNINQTSGFDNIFNAFDEIRFTQSYVPPLYIRQKAQIGVNDKNYWGELVMSIAENKISQTVSCFNAGTAGWLSIPSGATVTLRGEPLRITIPGIFFC